MKRCSIRVREGWIGGRERERIERDGWVGCSGIEWRGVSGNECRREVWVNDRERERERGRVEREVGGVKWSGSQKPSGVITSAITL